MKVFVVEYCDMVVGIYSTKMKATAYVKAEVEKYLSDFNSVSKDFLRSEKKEFSSRYNVYSQQVE